MKTAVGFLQNAIEKYIDYVEGSHKAEPFTITQLSEAVEQAKEMEKQQIINANEDASTNELGEFLTGEQYYNQEYAKTSNN